MAMPYTRTQLQARVFRDLPGQKNSANNTALTTTEVQEALMQGEMEWARRMRSFRRTATLTAVDEQALYVLPEDMFNIVDILWDDDDTPLQKIDEDVVRDDEPGFRSTDAASPSYWWMQGAATARLYPPTNVASDETITLDGYFVPFNIGGGVTSITQSGTPGTVTVVTNYRHNLRVGDSITISGSEVSAANAAWTVATVASTTSFTFSNATITTTTTDCYCYYTGGYLPMLADSDVSYIDFKYHLAIAYYAEWWLADNQLIGDPAMDAAGQRALVKFEEMISRHEEDRWI